MDKKFKIAVFSILLLFVLVLFFRFSSIGASVLWQASGNGNYLFPLILVSALLDSVNPCAFSILILTIAFLMSMGNLKSKILKIGGFYIFGIFLVYISIGLGILQALHLFNTPHFMGKLGALLLIALGIINIINEFIPKFPLKLKIPEAAHHKMAELMDKGSAAGAFFLGALVGICEFPCTGGPYLSILGLMHDKSYFTSVKGIIYLLIYNIIFILPLVIILFIAKNEQMFYKLQNTQNKNKKLMRYVGGIAMIILGTIILFV